MTTDNPSRLKEWLDAIPDRAFADRLSEWLNQRGKKGISTLYLPEAILAVSGIPEEIIPAIDIRSLIFQLMESFYLVLETLGIFMRNKNVTRLVSDSSWLLRKDDIDKTLTSLTQT